MEKQVVKKEEATLPSLSNWKQGQASTINPANILIPKLLVMQGLSKFVVEEKAQMGDFVDSVSGEILGSAREKAYKPVKIIPIKLWENWVVYERVDGSVKFSEIIDITPQNENWEQEAITPEGKQLVRFKAINAFVLVADKLDYFPFQMTFKSTSYTAGKKLATYFMQQEQMLRLPAFYNTVDVTAKKLTNEKGTFFVMDIDLTQKAKAKEEAIIMADKWFGVLNSQKLKVDQSDLHEAETTTKKVDDTRF